VIGVKKGVLAMRTGLVRRGLIGLAAAALIGVGTASAVGAEEANAGTSYANNETGELLVVSPTPGYATTVVTTEGPAVLIQESYIDEPAGDDVVVQFI
jgi:hypothetical protein